MQSGYFQPQIHVAEILKFFSELHCHCNALCGIMWSFHVRNARFPFTVLHIKFEKFISSLDFYLGVEESDQLIEKVLGLQS